MKSPLTFFALLLLLHTSTVAQTFSKGYYIDNQEEKISCYIKKENWANNPEYFHYKLDSLGKEQELSLVSVQEFGVKNITYKRAIVRMDKGKMVSGEISAGPKPEWVLDTVFLKVLVEGNADLLSYTQHGIYRFFFATDSIPVQQLVYKKYYRDNEIRENIQFRQQLINAMTCNYVQPSESIPYQSKDLIRFVEQYNACKRGGKRSLEHKRKKPSIWNSMYVTPYYHIYNGELRY